MSELKDIVLNLSNTLDDINTKINYYNQYMKSLEYFDFVQDYVLKRARLYNNNLFPLFSRYYSMIYDIFYSSDELSLIEGDSDFLEELVSSKIDKYKVDYNSASGFVDRPEVRSENMVEVIGNWNNVFDRDVTTLYSIRAFGNYRNKVIIPFRRRSGFDYLCFITVVNPSVEVYIGDEYLRPYSDKIKNQGLLIFDISKLSYDYTYYIVFEFDGTQTLGIMDVFFTNLYNNKTHVLKYDLSGKLFYTPFIEFKTMGYIGEARFNINNNFYTLDKDVLILPQDVLTEKTYSTSSLLYTLGERTYRGFSSDIPNIPFLYSDGTKNAIYTFSEVNLSSEDSVTVKKLSWVGKWVDYGSGNQLKLEPFGLYIIDTDNYVTDGVMQEFKFDKIFILGLDYICNLDVATGRYLYCLLYTSPSPRDLSTSRMPSSA